MTERNAAFDPSWAVRAIEAELSRDVSAPDTPEAIVDAPRVDMPPLPVEPNSPLAEAESPLSLHPPPANDDLSRVGAIRTALSRRPSKGFAFVAATVFSLLWLAFYCGYAFYGYSAAQAPSAVAWLRPEMVQYGLAALGPVVLIYAFAAHSRRLRELRFSANSIVEATARLAVPEAPRSADFTTLAQSIHRDVATMGACVERAVARASELEALVRSEVALLREASGDKERRMQSLVAELTSQREEILLGAGKVRDLIAEARARVAGDLETIGLSVAERLERSGAGIADALAAKFEDFGAALSRAGDAAVEEIVRQAAELRDETFEAASRVAEGLEASTRGSADRLLERVAEIDAGQTEFIRRVAEIDARQAEFVQRVAAAGAESLEAIRGEGLALSVQFASSAQAAIELLGDVGADIVGKLDAGGVQTVEAIRLHGLTVSTRLAETSNALAREFSETGQGLRDRLDDCGAKAVENLVRRGESVAVHIAGASEALTREFAGLERELEARLETAGAKAAEGIMLSSDSVSSRLAEIGRSASDELRDRLEDSRASFEVAQLQWFEQFSKRQSQTHALLLENLQGLRASLDVAVERAVETIVGPAGALVGALLEKTEQLQRNLRSLEEVVTEGGGSLIARIGAQAGQLDEGIARHVDVFDTVMSKRNRELDERITEHHGRFEGAAHKYVDDFEKASTGQRAAIDESLHSHVRLVNSATEDALAKFEISIRERSREAAARIFAHTGELVAAIQNLFSAIEETVVDRGGALDQTLAARHQDFETLFDSRLGVTEARMGDRLREIGVSLREITREIDQDLAARGKALAETLASDTSEATRTFFEGSRDIALGLETRSLEAVASMRTSAAAFGRALSDLGAGVEATLKAELEEMTGTLGGGVERLESRVVAPLRDIAGRFDSRGAEMAERLDGYRKALDEIIDNHAEAMRSSLTLGAEMIDAKLAARTHDFNREISAALENLGKAVDGRGGDLAGAVSQRIDDLRKLLEGEGAELLAKLGATGSAVSEQISGVSERAAQAFERRSTGLVALLTRRADDLLSAISASTSESVRSLGEMTERMASEVGTSTAALQSAAKSIEGRSPEVSGGTAPRPTRRSETKGAAAREAPAGRGGEPAKRAPSAAMTETDDLSVQVPLDS